MSSIEATALKWCSKCEEYKFVGLHFSPKGKHCRQCVRKMNAITNAKYKYAGSTYQSWDCMKTRCTNKNHPSYRGYGAKGITIYEPWLKYENFLADVGERPEWADGGLDRIDNSKGYEPGNVRWATRELQLENRTPKKDEVEVDPDDYTEARCRKCKFYYPLSGFPRSDTTISGRSTVCLLCLEQECEAKKMCRNPKMEGSRFCEKHWLHDPVLSRGGYEAPERELPKTYRFIFNEKTGSYQPVPTETEN